MNAPVNNSGAQPIAAIESPESFSFPILAVWACLIAIAVVTAILGTLWQHPMLALALCLPAALGVGRSSIRGAPIAVALTSLLGTLLPWFFRQTQPLATLIEAGLVTSVTLGLVCLLGAWHRGLLQRCQLSQTTDALTGLLNQVGFKLLLEGEINRAQREDSLLAVAFLDGDRFKSVNDRHGHLIGDQLLQLAAQAIRSCVRNYDSVARWGGDEFTVLLPGCSAKTAETVLQRVQQQQQPISWSIGVAVSGGNCRASDLLQAADRLMYQAKCSSPGSMRVQELSAEQTAPLVQNV